MARKNTRELAKRTAYELVREGRKPTVPEIQRRIGGSNTTILAGMDEFWNEIRELLAGANVSGLPENVADGMRALWRFAVEEANAGLVVYRKEADRRVAEAVAARTRAEETAATVTTRLEESERIHQELKAEVAKSRGEQDNLRSKWVTEEAARKQLEQRLAESLERVQQVTTEKEAEIQRAWETRNRDLEARDRAHAEAMEVEQKRADEMERRLVARMDKERTGRERAEIERERLAIDLNQTATQLSEKTTALNRVIREAEQFAVDLRDARSQLNAEVKARQGLELGLAQKKSEAAQLEQECNGWRTRAQKAEQSNASSSAQLKKSAIAIARLEALLEGKERSLSILQSQVEVLLKRVNGEPDLSHPNTDMG